MKIVYLSNSIIPSRAANSIHVMRMCQAFADNGHEVVLLAPEKTKEYEKSVDNLYEFYGVKETFQIIKVPSIDIKFLRNIYYGYKVLQKINIIKPDLVYGRDLYGCFLSSYSHNTIFEAHAPMQNFITCQLLNIMNKNTYYKKTVVISDALKKIIIAKQNIKLDNLLVAHDGADEVMDFDTKIQLQGNKNNLKIGYVGSLYKGKGIEVIASIFDKMNDNVEFHIIGGVEKDIKFWKKEIQSANVFFYGFIAQKDIHFYINALDICLLPNQKIVFTYGSSEKGINISEFTSPLKMFEYMAHQKAIIASKLPVLQEVLNEKNSILVDCEDMDAWIIAIENLRDKQLRNKLSQRAYQDFIEKYSWKNRAKEILNAL